MYKIWVTIFLYTLYEFFPDLAGNWYNQIQNFQIFQFFSNDEVFIYFVYGLHPVCLHFDFGRHIVIMVVNPRNYDFVLIGRASKIITSSILKYYLNSARSDWFIYTHAQFRCRELLWNVGIPIASDWLCCDLQLVVFSTKIKEKQ